MKPTYKQIWLITYPILISLLMENLIGLTDTAFLGRVGEVELGASALAGVYYMAIFMIGFGFSIGTQILIARRNGEKAYADIGPLLQQGILFLLLLAAVMFVVSRTFTPVVLRWIIDSGPVCDAAISYTNWLFLLVRRRYVPGVLRRHDQYEDTHGQFGHDGADQRGAELRADLR